MRLWDPVNGEPKGEPIQHVQTVNLIAFSPDGKDVATVCRSAADGAESILRIWETSSGAAVGKPIEHDRDVTVVVFNQAGVDFAAASWSTARIWTTATGEPVSPPLAHASRVNALAFSPDGKWLATGCGYSSGHVHDNAARIWNASTGELVGKPLNHGSYSDVTAVAFSPNGDHLATASADGARLWDLRESVEERRLERSGATTWSPSATTASIWLWQELKQPASGGSN